MPLLRNTEKEKIYKNLLGNIAKQREIYGVDRDKYCAMAGFAPSTLANRNRKPGQYTLDELYNISKGLRISLADLLTKM